jgi:hypothetical protein
MVRSLGLPGLLQLSVHLVFKHLGPACGTLQPLLGDSRDSQED